MFAQDCLYEDRTLQERKNRRKEDGNSKKKEENNLVQFLKKMEEEHDSQDEGIEDYNVGGYHPVHIGEIMLNRYVIIQKLGWGHFSTVWLCKDFKYNTYVAVKIQKSSPHYMEAAFDEVEILQAVQNKCHSKQWGKSRDDAHVVGLLNAFIHKTYYGNHFCMVFEILRCNLLDIIKRYNYSGLPLDLCQQISRQVLKGLDFLHRVCGVIHTDLKPENVMVCLNDEQLKQIVETGQLANNELFAQRTKMFQKLIQPQSIANEPNLKASQIEEKLKDQNLSKNQKKNLKKKLKKAKQQQTNQNQQNNAIQQSPKLQDLFDLKKGKITFNRGQPLKIPFRIKIADLGNACWKHHHYSTQIQTRQYRSPEVILGQSYNETSDIWSFGCMMYQILTGDLLFQPRKTDGWSKNQDHLAQMQQLIGPFHPHFIARSPKKAKYFEKSGKMKKFQVLNHYSLDFILRIKHKLIQQEASNFANFLLPTLIPEPQLRISAKKALQLPWLQRKIPKEYKMSQIGYSKLKQRFDTNQQQFQAKYQKAQKEQIQMSQRCLQNEDDNEQQQKRQIFAQIKLVDRSFTDLGYIGYCDGIALGELDMQGNWQF